MIDERFRQLTDSRSGFIVGLPNGQLACGATLTFSSAPSEGSPALYAPDFFLATAAPWAEPALYFECDRRELAEYLATLITSSEIPAPVWRAPDVNSFSQQFSEVMQLISESSWQKVVPVCFETTSWVPDHDERLGLLHRALRAPRTLNPFALWTGTSGEEGIVGATPETLFSLRDPRTVTTEALAGSAARSDPEYLELLFSNKEKHEHQLVIDEIVSCLTQFGQVTISDTEVLELPTIAHLMTRISLRSLVDLDLQHLSAALHPTPALGALPRAPGIEFLRRWDFEPKRQRFGAPFAIRRSDGSAHCLVAIRNIQWDSHGSKIGSGCGVVRGSVLDRELNEVALKRETVHRLFGV